MNKSLILFIAFVVVSFVRPASAEPTPVEADNVISVTIQVTQKSKSSTRTTQRNYHISFDKPVSTLLKFCVTENGSSRFCLYEVKRGKEIRVFDYEYSELDDSDVKYETQKIVSKR